MTVASAVPRAMAAEHLDCAAAGSVPPGSVPHDCACTNWQRPCPGPTWRGLIAGWISNRRNSWTKNFILAIAVNLFISMVFYLLMTTMALYAVARFQASDTAADPASSAFRTWLGHRQDFCGPTAGPCRPPQADPGDHGRLRGRLAALHSHRVTGRAAGAPHCARHGLQRRHHRRGSLRADPDPAYPARRGGPDTSACPPRFRRRWARLWGSCWPGWATITPCSTSAPQLP